MATATLEGVNKDRISEAAGYGRSEMEPGRDAWELLQRVWMSKPRQIRLPVDPVVIGNELGIEVLDDDQLAHEICSVLRKQPGIEAPQILLSPSDTHDLRRFPCAVALGHYSCNVETRLSGAWEFVEERDLLSARDRETEESYAFEFAAELLMPRVALREFLDIRSALALASTFGVTAEVMSFRLGRVGMGAR